MEKNFDVIAMGELLIDFTMNGQSEQGNNLFEACPGGAPCNVLAMLNKLGKKTAFLGKVGLLKAITLGLYSVFTASNEVMISISASI